MKQIYRDGTIVQINDFQDRLFSLLYNHLPGRLLLRPLVSPRISRVAGRFLSSSPSRIFIGPFVQKHHIDMGQFEPIAYDSYNAFFTRKFLPEARPVDRDPAHLISPCDSKLSVLPISADGIFTLKHTGYTIASLLRDDDLASAYHGGYALIFRLTVDDYHRYCYVCDGYSSPTVRIDGILHTVNPIVNNYVPIYKENAREYCILHTTSFGDILTMEVGALLVGKIVNHRRDGAKVQRGEEKGYFQFGGSTIVLLLKPGVVELDDYLIENSRQEIETVVRYGQKIGSRITP